MSTIVKIDHIFVRPEDQRKAEVKVFVRLKSPVVTEFGYSVTGLIIRVARKELSILTVFRTRKEEDDYDMDPETLVWEPVSELCDFEIIVSEGGETHVEENEAVGVLIIESVGAYVKLVKRPNTRWGIVPIVNSPWKRNNELKFILASDLSIGYDVGVVYQGKIERYREKTNESALDRMCRVPSEEARGMILSQFLGS